MSDILDTAQEIFPPTKELGPVEENSLITLVIQPDFSEALLTTRTPIEGKAGCTNISYVKAHADGSVQLVYDLFDDPDKYFENFPAGSPDAIHLQNEIRTEAIKRGMQWFITTDVIVRPKAP